jgi:predicted acyl esterase
MDQRRGGEWPGRAAGPGAAGSHIHVGAARGRSRSDRADRARAPCLIGPDRHPLHRQACRPGAQEAAARAKDAQPTFANVSKGWLQASHREKDLARTTALRPFYTHTNPQPLTPGEIYRFDIEMLPTAYVFRKGHRIRLEIANGDSPLTDAVFTHPYPPTAIGTDTIQHRGAYPSCLLLPVVKT